MPTTEEDVRLKCEKIVNESWSDAQKFYNEIKNIINKDGPKNKKENIILIIAANAALQQMTLDKAEDEIYFS